MHNAPCMAGAWAAAGTLPAVAGTPRSFAPSLLMDDRGDPLQAETLQPGEALQPDDRLNSSDGRWHLIYQLDGNLVLYDVNWRPIWHTSTDGSRPGMAIMQLVIDRKSVV